MQALHTAGLQHEPGFQGSRHLFTTNKLFIMLYRKKMRFKKRKAQRESSSGPLTQVEVRGPPVGVQHGVELCVLALLLQPLAVGHDGPAVVLLPEVLVAFVFVHLGQLCRVAPGAAASEETALPHHPRGHPQR